MEYAGEIRSNLKTARGNWGDEVMHTPEQERMAAEARARMSEKPLSSAAEEETQKRWEQARHAARSRHLPGQARWEDKANQEQRLVRIMHPYAVFRRLRAAGVDARVSSPLVSTWTPGRDGSLRHTFITQDSCRLWLNESPRRGLIGVNAWVRDETTGEPVPRTVTSLQEPCGPEWSLFHFDEFGVATAEKYRGWRTAMLQLILANVLTEAEVDRAFGAPLPNAASEYYRERLQLNRARRLGLTA